MVADILIGMFIFTIFRIIFNWCIADVPLTSVLSQLNNKGILGSITREDVHKGKDDSA